MTAQLIFMTDAPNLFVVPEDWLNSTDAYALVERLGVFWVKRMPGEDAAMLSARSRNVNSQSG